MKKNKRETEFNMEEHLSRESANSGQVIPPFSSIESYGQELNRPVYQNDPKYKELLFCFQNAQWDECLEKIDQFLSIYPNEVQLLAFKRDVEVRIKLQHVQHKHHSEEKRKQQRWWGIRIFLVAVLGLSAVVVVALAVNAYLKRQAQIKSEQQAAVVEQALDEKYQTAESFMRVDKPEEALRLYDEIKQINPNFRDVDQMIETAKQTIAVEEIYQEALQSIQEGKSDVALEILLKIEEMRPKYKDTPQLLEKIRHEQEIGSRLKEIRALYSREDWEGVIRAHQTIREVDPFYDVSEIKDILFVSYKNIIVDIAGRGDATIEEIERAEKYYRTALSMFPQSNEYAGEREELRQVAVELLANKYYLHALALLQSSNYSAKGLQELIDILSRAENIGTSSPAIKVEIEKSQLFLAAYDALLQRRWDNAISGFGKLYSKDENFAEGRVKYLLYEAYTGRGDTLFAYADFEGAAIDYQEAEKFAWNGEGNLLRLFQIQTRTAAALHKLGKTDESVEFYHYAFERVGYQQRLADSKGKDLLNTINQAERAYKNGDNLEAIRLYEVALEQVDELYKYTTTAVLQGDALADIAFEYGCTMESLRIANKLGEIMIVDGNQEILIPSISNTRP